MRIVLSATGNTNAGKILTKIKHDSILVSQYYRKAAQDWMFDCGLLLLDSGAFSVWNAGGTVDLDTYIQFATEMQARSTNLKVVSLDVIPGQKGRKPTRAEIATAMEQGLGNGDRMRNRGLEVIEVFHQGEPLAHLDSLVRRSNGGIVGISPANDHSIKARVNWLLRVRHHLLQVHGKENFPRTHGFAATGEAMVKAFPFYSSDSASWAVAYIYGVGLTHEGRKKVLYRSKHRYNDNKDQDALEYMTIKTIQYFKRLETETTEFWTKRGITWND